MNNMGEIIKQLRLQKGITQEELGKVIGVQKSAIRKYESGMVQNIKRSSIKKLADYFAVSPSYLLGYEDYSTTITNNNGIIGDQNHGNTIIVDSSGESLGEIERELISICAKLDIKRKTALLTKAYELLDME